MSGIGVDSRVRGGADPVRLMPTEGESGEGGKYPERCRVNPKHGLDTGHRLAAQQNPGQEG